MAPGRQMIRAVIVSSDGSPESARPSIRAVPRCNRAGTLALTGLVLLAGCGSSTSAMSTGSHPHSPHAALLRIGEAATFVGPLPGEKLKVTLLSYSPSLPGTSNDHPEFDYQFVAAHLRIANIGSASYQATPSKQLTIESTESQASKTAHMSEGPCAEAFASALHLGGGQSGEGCVPVQVLVVSTPSTLRFDPYGAGSAKHAVWSLKRS